MGKISIEKNNRNREKINQLLVMSMTFLVLMIGTVGLLSISWRIITTSIKLIDCNLMTQSYNESYVVTEQMTAQQEVINEERQSIYNSDDCIVREFSRTNFILKTVILMITIFAIVKIPEMWKFVIKQIFHYSKCSNKRVRVPVVKR